MEQTMIDKLGLEASPLEHIRHFEKALEESKGKPKPIGDSFAEWESRGKAKAERDMEAMAESLCITAYRDVEAVYSNEAWVQALEKRVAAEPLKLSEPIMRLNYLPLFLKHLEQHSEKIALNKHEEEITQIRRKLGEWQGKTPKPFSPEKINTDPRFPIDRVGFEKGMAFDKWLTEGLKSKTPIFFLPHSDWLKSLLRFWDEIYSPLEAEKANKIPIQPPPVVEEKKPDPQKPEQRGGDPINPMSEMRRLESEREAEEAARAEMDRQALFVTRHRGIFGRGR
jgi:hypothetical protein